MHEYQHVELKRAQRGAYVPHDMLTMPMFFCPRNLSSPRYAVGANDACALLPAARRADARTRCTAAYDCRLLAAGAFRTGAATPLVLLAIFGIISTATALYRTAAATALV